MTVMEKVARRLFHPIRDRLDRRPQLHFLHIGKAAGTQIVQIAEAANRRAAAFRVVTHPHAFNLSDVPAGQDYFFSIRSPISRFRSAFYSRKRKGRPRYNVEWTPDEAIAFGDFEEANSLAEALFAEGEEGDRAFRAMRSIGHVAINQVGWFGKRGNFLTLRPPLAIIRQEHFDADAARFLDRIGVPELAGALLGGPRAHSNSYEDVPALSDRARANLERWYGQDFELYRMCERWIVAQGASA